MAGERVGTYERSPCHVLVVDDDSRTLRAIRRMLHRHRPQWDVSLFTDARQALVFLRGDPPQVIVTDVSMPGLDGPSFLDQCQILFPAVPRVALSGGADEPLLLRTSAVAHRFLSKPLDAFTLLDSIEEVLDVARLVSDPLLRSLLGTNGALPALPDTLIRMERTLSDPAVTITEVAAVVEQDPGMAARMLQLVSSAFFGRRHPASTVLQAVAMLGVRRVRALVLSLAIFDTLATETLPPQLQVDTLGRRGMEVGTLSHAILPGPQADTAFTAGLLHDVGWLAAYRALPDKIPLLLERAGSLPCCSVQDELQILGASHQAMGAYLLALWGLDPTLVQAVRYHHHPACSRHSTPAPVDAVHVALGLLGGHGLERAWDLSMDEEHLDSLGLLARMDEWTELAEQMKRAR